MIEIIVLVLLMGKIGDMARRRGRSPNLFSLLLLAYWFSGEVTGGVLGYILSGTGGRQQCQPTTPKAASFPLCHQSASAVPSPPGSGIRWSAHDRRIAS